MVSSLAWMASMRPGLPASAAALPVFAFGRWGIGFFFQKQVNSM